MEKEQAQDIATFERIADLRFKQETEQMYDDEIAKAKELVDSYENAGIASAGKFVDKTTDLVLYRFKRIEGVFKTIYLEPLATGAPDGLTKESEYWLRNKVSKVVGDQVGVAQGLIKNLCWKFQPLPKERFNARWSQVQDEGRYIQQRLGESITLLVLMAAERKSKTDAPAAQHIHKEVNQSTREMLIFISHSAKDEALAFALIELLRAALGLRDEQIRCTSVDGYRLEAGANTNEQLKLEVRRAKAFIGLITPHSMASAYVLFELGARWGADLHMIPVLAGVEPHALEGPLKGINAISAKNISQLHQLVQNLGDRLGLQMQAAASYTRYGEKVIEKAQEQANIQEIKSKHQKPTPNLVPLRSRIARVSVNSRLKVFQESSSTAGDRAALAVFENMPVEGRQIGMVSDVAGYITYSNESGKEIQSLRVQTGCWLYANEEVSFPPRTKHELIVALKTNDDCIVIHESPENQFPAKIMQEKLLIQVKLVTTGDVLLTSRYVLILKNNEFLFTEED